MKTTLSCILSLFLLSACIQYKSAPDIIQSSKIQGENGYEVYVGLQVQNNYNFKKDILGNEYVPAEMHELYYALSSQADYQSRTSIATQLLNVSDRVCKDYIYYLLDSRSFINISTNSVKDIVSIFTATGVSERITNRITNITTGVGNIANNYYLTEQLLNKTFQKIKADRIVFKSLILAAWETNEPPIDAKNNQNYSIMQFLSDLDKYHNVCSFYNETFLVDSSTNINKRVKDFNAYSSVEESLIKNIVGM